MRGILLVLSLVLVSCSSGPYPVTSPYYDIPAGTVLELKQKLTVPAGGARVYLQNGSVVPHKSIDQYYAHCWFLSWQVRETTQTIVPDTFMVSESRKYEYYVHVRSDWQLASLFGGISLGGYPNGGPTAIEYSTVLTIHSNKNPDIREFACNHWEDPVDALHLTVAQMQTAVGDIVRIGIAAIEKGVY